MTGAATAAGEHYVVPGEENGRIPVLQVELAAIKEALADMVGVMREHCQQDEQTRLKVALMEKEQSKHCRDLNSLGELIRERATKEEVNQLRAMIKNPAVLVLGSSASVAILGEILRAVVPLLGGITGTGGP